MEAASAEHGEVALGNVVGSKLFNVLLCLRSSALAGAVAAALRTLAVDVGALLVATILVAVLIRRERTITRMEGTLALGPFCAFMVLTIIAG